MSIFKDFEFNIVINVVYRRKVDSLALLLLAFADLLSNICHTVWYRVVHSGCKRSYGGP